MFGDKGTVINYTVFEVFETFSNDRDYGRDDGYTVKKYGKLAAPKPKKG